MRRRLDVGEVELGHLADRFEDRAELFLHAFDVAFRYLETRELRHVQYVFSRDRQGFQSPRCVSAKRTGPWRGPSRGTRTSGGLSQLDVRRLQALIALHDLELDALAFLEGLVALHGDRGEVNEDVLPFLALDEAVALLVREPLDGALCQLLPPSQANDGSAGAVAILDRRTLRGTRHSSARRG